jgi:flagellar motor switch/type III secretory pathway protein FliN
MIMLLNHKELDAMEKKPNGANADAFDGSPQNESEEFDADDSAEDDSAENDGMQPDLETLLRSGELAADSSETEEDDDASNDDASNDGGEEAADVDFSHFDWKASDGEKEPEDAESVAALPAPTPQARAAVKKAAARRDVRLAGTPVERVELSLAFNVGETKLTAQEVASLQPGRVFPLDGRIDAPIAVTVNGIDFGRGTLVEIDGRVGVQLTEVRSR